MDGYRVMQVGPDFIVFAGDVGVLKCQTEKDAQTIIAVALDLLENPDEWWSVLRQRLAERRRAAVERHKCRHRSLRCPNRYAKSVGLGGCAVRG